MVITDPAYAALSAPQRAVLALQAAWAGKRPDPRVLIMPRQQRAEFDRLYGGAARANVRLGRLIAELHAKAEQERLAVAAWELETFAAAVLDELRWSLAPIGDAKVAAILEGGCALSCPVRLDVLDETPAGRRAGVLKAARDRLFGIADRAYATADILEVIREELGADPLHPDLRGLLAETLECVDDVLFCTIAWLGPVGLPHDAAAAAEVWRLVEDR